MKIIPTSPLSRAASTSISLFIALLCASFPLVETGCSNTQHKPTGIKDRTLGFYDLHSATMLNKQEIKTRRWTDINGISMSLIDLKFHDIPKRHTLAIAEYGDSITGKTYCVDVYECYRAPQSNDFLFFLLCHDVRAGSVESVGIGNQKGEVYIEFIRNSRDAKTQSIIQNQYSYCYDKRGVLSKMPGDFYSKVESK